VCAIDPFCCDTEWDSICTDEAQAEPLCDEGACTFTCGAPGSGDCCADHGTPGCDDEDCCAAVCAIDPFCCDTAWDGICADEAQAEPLCEECVFACGVPGSGDCCIDDGTPGCDDADCCNAVCASDPFCCDTAWDGICAGEAQAEPLCDQGACAEPEPCEAEIDIKPGSCPNSFNANNGVLPVAIVGTDSLNVADIDISSITICRCDGVGECISPLESPNGPHSTIEDAATPFTTGKGCDCHNLQGDGTPDLSLKFNRKALAEAFQLGDLPAGSNVELCVCFSVEGGGECCGSDCIRLVPIGGLGGNLGPK
jgi:hypothetical protein